MLEKVFKLVYAVMSIKKWKIKLKIWYSLPMFLLTFRVHFKEKICLVMEIYVSLYHLLDMLAQCAIAFKKLYLHCTVL